MTSRVVSGPAAAVASSSVVTTRVETPRSVRSSATARLPCGSAERGSSRPCWSPERAVARTIPAATSRRTGEQQTAGAGPHLAGGGGGRGAGTRSRVAVGDWRSFGGSPGRGGQQRGLAFSRSRSRACTVRYVCSVGGPAAVCDVVEVAGGGAQRYLVARAVSGPLRRRPRRRCGRGVGRGGRVLPGSGRWRACVPGRPRSSGRRQRAPRRPRGVLRRCGGCRRRARPGRRAVRCGVPSRHQQGDARPTTTQDEDDQPERSTRGGVRGGGEEIVEPVPEGGRGRAGAGSGRSRGTSAWTARARPPHGRGRAGSSPVRRRLAWQSVAVLL